MFDTLPSTARRRQLVVGAALLAASALAACDKDQPTSPTTSKPTAANALRGGIGQIPPATISWTVVDENNAIVKYPDAMFEVTGVFGYDQMFYDNSYPEDSDPAFGKVSLVGLAEGPYTVCQTGFAQGFGSPAAGAQCFSGYLNPGGHLTFTFFNPRPPHIQWVAVTNVGTLAGGGSAFTVKDSLGQGGAVTDNQWPDTDPLSGELQRTLPHPGTWTVCQTSAPTGLVTPAGQPCHSVVINWGGIGQGGQFASNYPYSLNWGVTEGVLDASNNYVPLAGAKFTVQYQRNTIKTPIDDNGPNDYDPRPGRVAMKLGAAGTYTVCEVQAPANHWLPKPPCQSVNVQYATPAFVGWFITPQSQVIYIP